MQQCGLSATLGRLLCKSLPHLLTLNTDPVVRHVVRLVATELRLSPRGRASTRFVGAPHTQCTVAHIRSYAVCVQNDDSTCIAMGPLEPRTTQSSLANRKAQ